MTELAGAVMTYNLMTLLAPALAAWSAYKLASHLTRNWAASLFAGYVFGFSSYTMAQMLGDHLNLDAVFLVPLVVLICIKRLQGNYGRTRFVGILGVSLVLQMGISLEILATLCVFGALAWFIFFACLMRADRVALLHFASEVILAALLAVTLASPFLAFFLKGLAEAPPEINPVAFYSADLLNYVVPTRLTGIGGAFFRPIAEHFSGNIGEQGAYLGFPLVLLLSGCFLGGLSKPHIRALFICTTFFAVFSLGPILHVDGRTLPIVLPWSMAARLPLIGQALPTRFTMYVSLCASIATALWLATPSVRLRHGKFVLAGLACLCLAPAPGTFGWSHWSNQPFFTPQNVRSGLTQHTPGKLPNVLILPFGATGPGMAWQINANMQFTQSAGYVGFIPVSERTQTIVSDLWEGKPGPAFARRMTDYCIRHKVDFILIGPSTPPPLTRAIAAMGWPQRVDHGVIVVPVPKATC